MTNPIIQRVLELLKTLFITTIKLLSIMIAFSCKILGAVLIKIGELVDKLVSK